MRIMFAAAAAALVCSAPATAAAYLTGKYVGTITEQLVPGVDPNSAMGETVTVSFNIPTATLYDPDGTGWLASGPSSDPAFFSVTTSRGLQWLAREEMLDNGLRITEDGSGFYGFFVPMRNDQPLISINVSDGAGSFFIQGTDRFGGALYNNISTSLGFKGQLRPAEVPGGSGQPGVPEPASWALMIVGFGLIGTIVRRRNVRRGVAPLATA